MGSDINGSVNREPAVIRQEGQRIDAMHGFDGSYHDKIVANDGLNASYVREGGTVIVNENRPDPYAPYPYRGAPPSGPKP